MLNKLGLSKKLNRKLGSFFATGAFCSLMAVNAFAGSESAVGMGDYGNQSDCSNPSGYYFTVNGGWGYIGLDKADVTTIQHNKAKTDYGYFMSELDIEKRSVATVGASFGYLGEDSKGIEATFWYQPEVDVERAADKVKQYKYSSAGGLLKFLWGTSMYSDSFFPYAFVGIGGGAHTLDGSIATAPKAGAVSPWAPDGSFADYGMFYDGTVAAGAGAPVPAGQSVICKANDGTPLDATLICAEHTAAIEDDYALFYLSTKTPDKAILDPALYAVPKTSESVSSIFYAAGAGLDFAIMDSTYVGVNYQWLGSFVKNKFEDSSTSLPSALKTAPNVKLRYGIHNVFAHLKFFI